MDKELIKEIDKLLKELIEVGIIAQTKDTNENTNKNDLVIASLESFLL